MTDLHAGIAQRERRPSPPETCRIEPATRSTAFDRLSWHDGHRDAVDGRPWRVTPDQILARTYDGDRDVLSYLVGYRAGELDRLRSAVV